MRVDPLQGPDGVLIENGHLVESLQSAIRRGSLSLDVLPGLIVRLVDEDRWRHRRDRALQRDVTFDQFAAFVSAAIPAGLGIALDDLKRLCRDHPAALDAIDRAVRQPVGINQYAMVTDGAVDNINSPINQPMTTTRPTGTSADAALRRLRDQRPDLHGRVLAGDLTAHAAMREAGFRKPTLTVRLDDAGALAAALGRHLDRIFLAELIAELHHVADEMESLS